MARGVIQGRSMLDLIRGSLHKMRHGIRRKVPNAGNERVHFLGRRILERRKRRGKQQKRRSMVNLITSKYK
jgi:hypothetical protein